MNISSEVFTTGTDDPQPNTILQIDLWNLRRRLYAKLKSNGQGLVRFQSRNNNKINQRR